MSYNNRYVPASRQLQYYEKKSCRDYPYMLHPVDHTKYFITSSYPEDDNEEFSVKQKAFIRFHRNHMLIKHILSDVIVPDVRYVASSAKLKTLKTQAANLTEYQKKMNAELQHEEEKYNMKKRTYSENDMQFKKQMEKYSAQVVDEDRFQVMVEEQYNILKHEQNLTDKTDDSNIYKTTEEQQDYHLKARCPENIYLQAPLATKHWMSC